MTRSLLLSSRLPSRTGWANAGSRCVYCWFFFSFGQLHIAWRRNTTCEAMGRFNLNVITSLSSLGCAIITRRSAPAVARAAHVTVPTRCCFAAAAVSTRVPLAFASGAMCTIRHANDARVRQYQGHVRPHSLGRRYRGSPGRDSRMILNMTVAIFMLKLSKLTFDLLIFELRFNDK
jgi:hypothetical protein